MSATADTQTGEGGLPEGAEPSNGLTQEIAFEILSCRRRRHVLHCLKQRDEPVELRELSIQLAAWENDVPRRAVEYDQRMRVYTALRQSHLPKMAQADIVEFDSRTGTVTLTEEASELEVYLDVVPHDEIAWSKYYAGVSVLSLGLVTANGLDVFPFSLLPHLWIAVVITVLFAASAVAHWRHNLEMKLGGEGAPPGDR